MRIKEQIEWLRNSHCEENECYICDFDNELADTLEKLNAVYEAFMADDGIKSVSDELADAVAAIQEDEG